MLVAVIAARNERGAPAIAGVGHLFSSSSNFRTRWWENGLDAFRDAPWRGTGAGTFRTVETLAHDPAHATVSPHNALVAALQGTGILGGIAVLVAGVAIVARPGRGRAPLAGAHGRDRARAGGRRAAAARPRRRHVGDAGAGRDDLPRGRRAAAGAADASRRRPRCGTGWRVAGVAVAACSSVGSTRSAVGRSGGTAGASAATPVESLAQARDALQLEPRAADAHVVAASAREALGDPVGALADLVAALRLEPDNYNAWLGAARLQSSAFGDQAGAVTTLRRAYLASGQRRQVRTELNAAEPRSGLPLTP